MIDFAFQGGIWQVDPGGNTDPMLLAGPTVEDFQRSGSPTLSPTSHGLQMADP